MTKKFIIYFILELFLLSIFVILFHGILNHILFYTLEDFQFKGYLWENWTVLLSLFLGYMVYILYHIIKIENVDNKLNEMTDTLNSFKLNMRESKYPMITEFKLSKNNLNIYECNFRIHKDPQNVVLCNVMGESEKDCYSKSFETIENILNKP